MRIEMTQEQIAERIMQCDTEFFSVAFIKRGNGELRHMNCRRGVSKYVTGAGERYNPTEKHLIRVWDRNVADASKAYRSINIDGLVEARIGKNQYVVKR